jgi:hypothetical protein
VPRPQGSPAVTFMIPFQLSPVDTRNSVRKAMPKLVKVACLLRPSQGLSSLHSRRKKIPLVGHALASTKAAQWPERQRYHGPWVGMKPAGHI